MKQFLLACSILLALLPAPAFTQDEQRLFKGVELYQEGKFQEAVEVLSQFIEKEKDSWVAYTYLGGSLANLGRNDEAIVILSTKPVGKVRPSVFPLDSPMEILKKAKAINTKDARRNKTEGDVVLFVEFKGNGEVGFVLPTKPLPDGLTDSAIEAARKFKFRPAIKNQKPVSTIRTITFTFGNYR
ncbi:MAG: energy transducer TonB [bacterium]|nr:energy transducer TonB [bacterium]